MRIIALMDASRHGKTTSIKYAAKEFMIRFAQTNPIEFARDKSVEPDDIRIAIEFENGYRTAFCSGGDDDTIMDENINFALTNNCNLMVTASRERGASKSKLSSWLNQNNNNDGLIIRAIDFWTSPSSLYDNANYHRRLSKLTATHLLNIIEYAMHRP